MVQGQIEQCMLLDSRALLHTLALFVWAQNLEQNCQAALFKLTLSGGPFRTSQILRSRS